VEEKEEKKEGVVKVNGEREEKSIRSNSTRSSTYLTFSLNLEGEHKNNIHRFLYLLGFVKRIRFIATQSCWVLLCFLMC
jgi:hypothetical protein